MLQIDSNTPSSRALLVQSILLDLPGSADFSDVTANLAPSVASHSVQHYLLPDRSSRTFDRNDSLILWVCQVGFSPTEERDISTTLRDIQARAREMINEHKAQVSVYLTAIH